MTTLGQRLREAREAANLKPIEASTAAGISRSHLSKIENDKDRPGFGLIFKLSVIYRCPLEQLIPDEEEFRGVEVAANQEERDWLLLFRRMSPEQRQALLALVKGGR